MRPFLGYAVVLSLAAAAPIARADDASRRAKAEQMLALTKTDSLMEGQLSGLQARVGELAKRETGVAPLNPEQTKLTNDYLKQVQDLTTDEVSWPKLRPGIVQAYADSFTEPELDGILAFYKTPAGQAIITKTPELATKTMTTVQGHIKDLQPKLAAMTEEYKTKLKAAAPASAAPTPAGAAAAPTLTPKATPAKPAAK